MAYYTKATLKQFDIKYKIDVEIQLEKPANLTPIERKEFYKKCLELRHEQLQQPIFESIENGVLETDTHYTKAVEQQRKFIKKYSIYENFENIQYFDDKMQHWFYNNHIYFKILREISKVHIHSAYMKVLNKFMWLNYTKYAHVIETEKNMIARCSRLRLDPTDIQINVAMFCEILRAFDYSEFKPDEFNINTIYKTYALSGKTMGCKYGSPPENFLEYLPDFAFLNNPEIFKVVSNGRFVHHAIFEKKLRYLK
jgi:hypothetical protein